jgi:CheY-like chemotaxis protein
MNRSCVLIVDDEEDVRDSVKDVVEMIGCAAITAANGADGLRMLSEHSPCLAIIDLIMPVMTGLEMIDAMRRDIRFSNVGVVISTSAPERAPKGVMLVPKPIDITALTSFIRRACTCTS